MNRQPKLPLEDRLYAEMLFALIDREDEEKKKAPCLKRVELFRARARARLAELELLQTKLSLIPYARVKRHLGQILSARAGDAAANEAARAVVAAKNRARDAHPRVRVQKVKAALQRTFSRTLKGITEDASPFWQRLQARVERAGEIAWLLQPQTIERHKAALRKKLLEMP